MSFPTYERYKDSGVEWFEKVPGHWALVRTGSLEHTGSDFVSGPFGSSLGSDDYVNDGIPVIRGLNTTLKAERRFVADGFVFVNESKFRELSRCDARPGDLIFTARGTVGKVGIVPHEVPRALISPNQLRFRPENPAVNADYLFYLFSSSGLLAEITLIADSVAQPNLNLGSLKSIRIPLPSLDEQSAIATFLDCEIGKIDALVAEQKRLIELLKEKRQAVISQAVTKGLDPNASMKDSGIEWLGKVPAHWHADPLKRTWNVTDCKHLTAEFVDDGVPLVSIKEVQGRFVDLSSAKQTTDGFYQQLVEGNRRPQVGDLIFSRNATVGEVAQVAEWHPPFAMGQDVCLLRKKDCGSSTEFLQHVVRSSSFINQLAIQMIGSTFKRINVEEIRNIIVPVPPFHEQHLIAEFLESENGKSDALVDEATTAIDLLQERRSALISAAVTGKIDVRDRVSQQVAAE